MTGPKATTLAALREAEAAGCTRTEAMKRTGFSRPTVLKYERLFGLKFKPSLPRARRHDETYRVYTHVLDGELIYIGAGKGRRPYDMCGRSPEWKAKVAGREREIQVGIIARFHDKRPALNLENRLIWGCAPTCCKKPGNAEDTTARDTAIRHKRATGMTLQAIGDQYGLTRERVRQICDGDTDRLARREYNHQRYHAIKARQCEAAA